MEGFEPPASGFANPRAIHLRHILNFKNKKSADAPWQQRRERKREE
jgi:hypothetical protein